ncbi:Coenzyme F390 synthetase [Burkholderiales bacterium]|nr:Coenzyme F390 synthetase [Burkholderiales bacterium]
MAQALARLRATQVTAPQPRCADPPHGNMTAPLMTLLATAMRHRRNAHLSRRQFEAERLLRFRALVRHTLPQSPYYSAIMRERGIDPDRCAPSDFPILTKRLLREHFDSIVTDRRVTREAIVQFLQRSHDPAELYLGEFHALHTSGSSGEVGHFVFSRRDWMRGYAGLSRLSQPRLRRTRCVFYGATGGHFGGVSWAVTACQGLGRWFFDVKCVDINSPLAQTRSWLNDFQPHVLGGYVSGHKILAKEQLEGRLRIHPEMVLSGAEPLSPGDQAWLGTVFGCPCINLYGATESMLMGIARPGDAGMTVFDDELILEVGSEHILVTNLFSRTMPLIRYRVDDTVRFTDLKSPYGPYPVIEQVVGRNEWVPQFRNRQGELDFVSPHYINEIFVPGVWRFQMRWLDETSFRFVVCLDSGLSASQRIAAIGAVKARLHEILGQKGLSNVQFGVDVVEDIAVDPATGKFRLVLPGGEAPAH